MPNFNNSNSNNEENNYAKYYFKESNFVHIQQGATTTNNGQKRQANVKIPNYRDSKHSFNFFVKVMNNMDRYKNKTTPEIYNIARQLNTDYYKLQISIRKKFENKKGKTTKPKKSERKIFNTFPLCAIILYVERVTQGGKILLPSLSLKEYNSVIKRIKTEWKSAKNKKEVELQIFMDYMDNEIIKKYYKDTEFLRRRTVDNYLYVGNKNILNIEEKEWQKIKKVSTEAERRLNNNNNGLTTPETIVIAAILYVIPKFNTNKINVDNMRTVTITLNKIKRMYEGASSFLKN